MVVLLFVVEFTMDMPDSDRHPLSDSKVIGQLNDEQFHSQMRPVPLLFMTN